MILTLLALPAIWLLLTYAFWLLPVTLVFPDSWHAIAVSAGAWLYFWNPVFPINEMIQVTLFDLEVLSVALSFKAAFWVVHFIRGVSYYTA